MTNHAKTLVLLYEPGHVEEFLCHPLSRSTHTVTVICDLQTEMRAKEKNLSFVSGRAFFPSDASRFQMAREWPERMFEHPQWKQFVYRGVPLSGVFTTHIQVYLLKLLQWTTVIDQLIGAYPEAQQLIVFPSHEETPLKGKPLTREQLDAVVACAKLVGEQRGLEVIVVPKVARSTRGIRVYRVRFALRQMCFGFAALVWNLYMQSIPHKQGATRVLVSDYWRNIAPLLAQMTNPELVLFDRGEARHAGLSTMLQLRMCLYHFSSFPEWGRRGERAQTAQLFAREWATHTKELLPECEVDGLSLRPALEAVLDELVNHLSLSFLCDVDGAYALFVHTKPQMVVVRASISIQTHFAILAWVARALRIPSLELQHGLEYLGPGSLSATHHAEYIAVYGQAVQDEFALLGYPREKVPAIGSPRFDAYAAYTQAASKRPSSLTVLCVTPTMDNEGGDSAYDAEAYFIAIARALETIPEASAIIKLRPGDSPEWYRTLIHTVFARIPHTIAQKEPLTELFMSADVVVSYFSTVLLEALQCGKPVVAVGVVPFEKEALTFHFTRYLKDTALMVAYTPVELEQALQKLADSTALRRELGEHARSVMARLHCFDGHASERLVTLITTLAQKGSSRGS